MPTALINQIDALLPQTQCRLCSYKGCRPYAEAIVLNGEKIDRCLPGGTATLQRLAEVTGQDATPFMIEMQQKQKPPQVAVIREQDCIGCTKCIQACPIDAIVGSAKQMHTIIADECTGCELCIEPCPVDCITLLSIPAKSETEQRQKALLAKKRYTSRNERLAEAPVTQTDHFQTIGLQERKKAIEATLLRVKNKKSALLNPKKGNENS